MRHVLPAAALVASALLLSPPAGADDDDHSHHDSHPRISVTVAFGVGLNTAQPGNAANHHVLPKRIRVKAGGVVNFAVGGFHQIYVYLPGKLPEHVAVPTGSPPPLFINDKDRLYYEGIVPAGGPPPGTPASANPSNAVNRMEPVSFAQKGTYLVICNVRPHFADGMWAWVVVD